jgi:hypothetical protein
MVAGHGCLLFVGIALLMILSNGIDCVCGEEISMTYSFLQSSIATVKSVFGPWSLWTHTTSKQIKESVGDEHQMRLPTKESHTKVVFDSFYEEDYGITNMYKEEQPSQHEIGRLSHQRRRDSCDRHDASQNCGAVHPDDGKSRF